MHTLSRLLLAAAPALLLPAAAWAEVPAGTQIDDALVIDVTDTGFTSISELLPGFIPAELPVPDIRQSGSLAFRWTLDVQGIDVDLDLIDAAITPQNGFLAVDADLDVSMNSPSAPASIKFVYHTPGWLGGPWTIADCDFYAKPINVDVGTNIYMDVVTDPDGTRRLDATFSTVDWGWSFTGTDLQVDNCWIGSINDILEYIDFSLFDLVKGPIEGLIDDQVQTLVRDLEPTLEDAFNSVSLDETFDFNNAQLHVKIEPYDVEIIPAGMRIVTAGLAEAEEAACVAGLGPSGSAGTDTGTPGIGDPPNGIGVYDVGILGNDDFVNQVLFAAYRGGALCFDLAGDQGDLPINTGLLPLLAGDAFADLFTETKPMIIELRPTIPPVAAPGGPHDVTVVADDLGLDLYGEIDGRQALIVGLELDIEAGVDLLFDGTTGELGLEVDLGGDDLTASVRENEFAPDANDAIAGQVGTLFDTLAAPILGSALGDLSFAIPSFGGFGLTTLDAAPGGDAEDWFGFYANAGPVAYGSGGCGDSGGCADGGGDGCDQGCASSGVAGRGAVLVLLPLLVAGLRRRRRE